MERPPVFMDWALDVVKFATFHRLIQEAFSIIPIDSLTAVF